ncbi:MAG: helix-turn-helix transcriptional regulator [Planctomycetes bacterium]|nr:helix-turn-helix transcriptional regulator [Planctomycetota bacterium]
MDELIVRVLRTVACHTRLRIISRLLAGEEAAPSRLARELRLRRDLVSAHLARLSSAGLVRRRRSGAHCYYAARSPYNDAALSGQVVAWLREALAPAPPGSAPGPRGGAHTKSAQPDAGKVLFDAATAFTSVRRLQILRRLSRGDAVTVATLMRELRMSDAAASRHTEKLIRRGYISAVRDGRSLAYRLAPDAKKPHHARLLDIVRTHWGEGELRS